MAQRANVDNHMIDGVPISSFGAMYSGVAYTKKHSETMKTAISNPEEHLNKRIAMLTQLETDLNNAFKQKYQTHITNGEPSAYAADLAKSYVMKLREIGLQETNAAYPEDINQTAMNLTWRGNPSAALGFDPSSVNGKKPRAPRRKTAKK